MNKTPKQSLTLPQDTGVLRERVLRAISPIKQIDSKTKSEKGFLISARRTVGADNLPPDYVVYFLLVNLLKFRDLGCYEKIAWSIPIDFHGYADLIEHRRSGLGIFSQINLEAEENSQKIARLLYNGIRVGKPFFKWMADEAIKGSKLTVVNNGPKLYSR